VEYHFLVSLLSTHFNSYLASSSREERYTKEQTNNEREKRGRMFEETAEENHNVVWNTRVVLSELNKLPSTTPQEKLPIPYSPSLSSSPTMPSSDRIDCHVPPIMKIENSEEEEESRLRQELNRIRNYIMLLKRANQLLLMLKEEMMVRRRR
jgi:hypothetical protein